MTDSEADELWPPGAADEAIRRHREVEAAAGRIVPFDDDELYTLIFGDLPGTRQ
jgi:hypothetical protein